MPVKVTVNAGHKVHLIETDEHKTPADEPFDISDVDFDELSKLGSVSKFVPEKVEPEKGAAVPAKPASDKAS